MKKTLIPTVAALALIACSCGSRSSENNTGTEIENTEAEAVELVPADTFSYKGYAMLADILAGRAPSDPTFLSNITSSAAFAVHTEEQKATWNNYKANIVDKIRSWSAKNIKDACDTIFYPFGGPDFNYLSSFFPNVRSTVMIGIERPGSLPLVAGGIKQLDALRKSVRTNLKASFFVTKDMAKDLNEDIYGTLPVMLMFMGLHGYEVITVNPVELDAEGQIAYTNPDQVWAHTLDKKFDNGYEILYRQPGEKGARSLYYLRTDLSNPGIVNSGVEKMIADKFKGQTAMLKAASYLMHTEHFSKIREAILNNCDMVLTGPSGIPYKAFDQNSWDVTLHGSYCGPIADFKTFPQKDLEMAYTKTQSSPLGFRYDYGNGTQLFIAKRK